MASKDVMFKPLIQGLIMFTMFFSGGMIPAYLNVRSLGLYNSLWALILPGALSVYNSIICKTAIESVPESLKESAYIDGANDVIILFKIIVPLIKATLAVLLLYYGVAHWNAWFNASIYLKDNACAFQRARQRRFGPAHGAADTHGGHAALLHRRCAERDGRFDADGEAELPGLGAGDAGAVLGGAVRRGDDELGVKRAVLRKQIAAEGGDAALVHGLLVGVGDGQLGAVVGRRHDNIRRCVGYGILEHNGRGIERFGVGAPEKAADHRHVPLVGRGMQLF